MENKKQSNTIITDWLEKHGDPEIDKKVEERLEQITKEIMSNKKQSSIDWLVEQLIPNAMRMFDATTCNAIEQAKAMHKKEIIDAFRSGLKSPYHQDYHWHPQQNTGTKSEHYYNETFGRQDERDRSIKE